jgi:nitric oxide dioxygenase
VTPDQIRLVQESWANLRPDRNDVSARFYVHLFALDPSIKDLFQNDQVSQEQKFADQLDEIVAVIGTFDRFYERVRASGKDHLGYGVRPSHYRVAGRALQEALADSMGDEFTPELRNAWGQAYDLVAEVMMSARD